MKFPHVYLEFLSPAFMTIMCLVLVSGFNANFFYQDLAEKIPFSAQAESATAFLYMMSSVLA